MSGGLPYGLDTATIKPGAVRSMTTDKLASFSLGGTKKTPFQKHKEALEAKRKAEAEQTAAEYAQWVEDFEGDADKPKQFISGGVMGQGNAGALRPPPRPQGTATIRAPQKRLPSAAASKMFAPQEEDIDGDDIDGEDIDGLPVKAPPKMGPRIAAPVLRKGAPPQPKKSAETRPSQMAMFMEELKREQEERDIRGERDGDYRNRGEQPSSFDNQDPDTTNLYVGNLSPTITEEILFREFQKFGAIQSVKIMWPRSEEEKARARHCGFVAFVNRNDAAAAKDEMNETELYGYVMRIGWGKAVAKPSPAITLANIQARAAQGAAAITGNAIPPLHAMGGNAIPPPHVAMGNAVPPPHSMGAGAMSMQPTSMMPQPPGGAKVVRLPGAAQPLIDRLALFVAEEGHAFEQVIMEREANNPKYRFLFDQSSPDHLYYRWKVVSLCSGGMEEAWDTQALQLEAGGPIWTPPPCSRPV
eukprot:CAMPEP_0183345332 /NCGR_PEP_ID=MMETSP0164_2-20130417/10796_1 /TAXON_ID=221442 /ORGANISM="Coccolithus pelagicus ssp braarudi, Strain PLY182g" /LENGTH=471 /DNA_ID=CAMNT_0025516465 /DNA_START=45 /DNA_END=1456 /DNA_ORIENTATION=-